MANRRADVSISESGGLVPAYRTEWAADVVSADGQTVRIRPIRVQDSEKVLQLYERLSPESMYLRSSRRSRSDGARTSASRRSTRTSTS